METHLSRDGARCDEVGPAERGEKVVESGLIGHIDGRDLQTELVFIPVKDVVVTHRDVKEIAGSDARRVVVVILRSGSRNRDSRRSVLRGRTAGQR